MQNKLTTLDSYRTTSTQEIDFSTLLKTTSSSSEGKVLLENVSHSRKHLLYNLIANQSVGASTYENAFVEYLSHMYGFVFDLEEENVSESVIIVDELELSSDGTATLQRSPQTTQSLDDQTVMDHKSNSKLRHAIPFNWIDGRSKVQVRDSLWDIICVGLLYSTALKREAQNERDLKIAFKLMQKSSSILQFIQDLSNQLDKQYLSPMPYHFTMIGQNSAVLVMKLVAQAEAQETALFVSLDKLEERPVMAVQISRAIVEKYDQVLQQHVPNTATHWMLHLRYKHSYYNALSYIYCAMEMNKQDENGIAIACMKTANALASQIDLKPIVSNKEFANVKDHFESQLKELKSMATRYLEKFEHENSLVYRQQVPDSVPVDRLPEAKSVGKIPEFSFPEPASKWTKEVYNQLTQNQSIVVAPQQQQVPQQQMDQDHSLPSLDQQQSSPPSQTTTLDNTVEQTTAASKPTPREKPSSRSNDGFSLCHIL